MKRSYSMKNRTLALCGLAGITFGGLGGCINDILFVVAPFLT